MLLNNNSLIMQWNRDENGNPMSWHIPLEVQQISPTHGVIQLVQVPDQHQRIKIVTEENIHLTEVFNIEDITLDSFYVDYGVGIVRFHESQRGKLVKVDYYGRGVILISDSRIFHRDGENVADTWDNILDRSKDALDLIESAGGLVGAMKEIDKKIEQGEATADRLENFITETQFYGYTITLSREAFVVKAKESGEVGKTEISTVYTDVIVYKGAKQIVPVLSIEQEHGCTFKVDGQRVKLTSMDINVIKANAVLNIDCGDGLVAQRKLEVTKVFDGVSQYSIEMTNPFYSFEANSEGYIEEEKTITCDISVTKANVDYTNYSISVQNAPRGLRYDIGTSSVDFTCTTGNSLPSSGSCLVVVTIDGTSFNKAFTWNKTRKGQDAKSLVLIGGQILRYETPDYSDIPTPHRSTVTAKIVGLSGTPKWYVRDNTTWNLLEGQVGTELTFMYNDATIWGNRKETTIKCELEGYEDELTLVKLATGGNGTDAITVILTNESHTVAIDNSGQVHESEMAKATTQVLAYQGIEAVTPILSKGTCDGCDISIDGNMVGLRSLDNSFSTATAVINVNVNGTVIPKTWTISKAKQGTDGATGENGSSYILNVTEGTRSFTYSQINLDPRPSVSATFVGSLYENGTEVIEGVSYYWVARGHLRGSSVGKTFTPTIAKTFDESILNNDIQLTATYKGNTVVQTIPISVTKDANGLDWVQEWDDTKTEVRGNLILTPKIFAGSYIQEHDLVTGVAIGKDVLNDGNTIGVAGYQNNKTTFLLDTDGTLMVGNPFEQDSTGLYFDGENFTLKVNELSIEGSSVATSDELVTKVDEAINSAKEEVKAEIEDVISQVNSLDSYMNNALKDGILDEVERNHLHTLYENISSEYLDTIAQYRSIAGNEYLTDEAMLAVLEGHFTAYLTCFEALSDAFNAIMEAEVLTGEDVEAFKNAISDLRVASTDLLQSLTNALTCISEAQANEIVTNAKLEIKQEIDDVSGALTDLETTMNGDFKSGLISTMNLTTLKSKLSQLETEKADIDGQYKGLIENSKLGATSRTNLANAKGELDTAHDQLIIKINTAITDLLMTEAELQEINRLITVYGEKLRAYSEVAQQANADIALNLAQGAVQALNQEDIFNKLTNNGETQGIYLQNGKVYINGEYVNTRNLRAVRNDGTETFKVDSEGNVSIKANSFHLVGTDTNLADKNYVDTAIGNANINLTQDKVFNALTNNGQTQGIYLENSKIYINGEYIKAKSISGDKISAGVITATNGKSTINLDNGAMNLGNTTDASYLQWTGTDLNIKANSINIGTSSVATSTDVGNAKNEAINSANSNTANTLKGYYTKAQTDSAIKVAKDEINLGVSGTYETKTNVETKVSSTLNSAKSYADTKKTEAINTASTDATNKVNSAKNELNTEINKKANSVDVYQKSETYTKAETDSKIKVAKDSIDLSVSTLQTTVANHTTQINSKVDLTTVNDKINAIQVGGRNLLPRARTFENWQGVGQNGVKVVKDGFKTGMNSLKFAQGGEAIVDNELQKKALKNLANTHMIVTNPEDSAYSLYPNPPKGSTFNSVNRDGSLRKGEISSNGSCWAIISAYKYYTEVPTTSDIEQKLLQIMKDCADFMCDNLSVGRFNSMNFEFIDISYKYSSKTRAGWTVGTYKELYLSTMFLQVKSLTYAYKIHKNQRYLDTAYKVLDSLYNVQIYIKDKVAKGDLPTEADGAFYEYLACDNLSSSNRFSGSTKILPLGMGYYISQAVDTLIEIVGDNERTTAKGDSYRPSTIKTEYTKFLSSMIKTGNLTAKPTNLPYGHYYKSEDGTFKLGNWNFIDDAFGDEWFVGDVVCYTIIGLASLGFKTEAKQYMNAYYSLKVPNSSGRFTGDTVFYDRIDFSTGTHLPDDDSVSITYTALYMEMGVILNEMTHVENCANTLLKWQVSEPNNIKVDGAYMWDISKDTSSLELKSYGEIVNSEFFKYLSPQKIRNRATTASVSTALTSNITGKEFALSGWLKASNWNALANGLNACLKIGGKTYASLKLSDVIKNNNWTRFELLGSVEKEDEILTFELINNTSTTVEVAVLKLEKGNKITDFTDAPEDVEDNIVTSKNDAISSANNTLATTIANYYTKTQTDSQINVAKTAITQSVASTYETKSDVTSKINGVNSSISNLQSRMSSAESKITDTAITNVVKQNFYTKEETENQITNKGYQTASQVQQTVNNLQIKFAESGGYNLFLNSGFKKNMSYWGTHTHNSPTGGSIGRLTSADQWGFPDSAVNCACIRLSNQSGIEYGISQAVKTTIGKKYTISFYYAGHRLNSANLIVRNSNGSWLASKAITSFPSGGNSNANNWSKHTLTFTASATSHTVNIVITNAGSDGYMWIAKPQVVEGELDLPYSPNPSEVYDGIIQMDKDGIKVSTSNGGWTDFTSLGMNVYNRSNKLSLGTRNGGLTYHGGGAYLGFTSESIVEAYNTRGVCISTANDGAYISLGHSSATDPFGGFSATPYLSVAKQDFGDSSSFYRKGVNIHTTLNLNTQNTNRAGTINFGTNNTSKIFESSANNLCMFGDNGAVLGYREGSNNITKFKITEGSNSSTSYIDSYAHWQFNQWNLNNVGQLEVVSRLKMQGTSSIYFNANATHPSVMWHSSNDNKLNIFGDNGVDIGYREGDTNRPILKITEGESGAYRLQSFSHWHFNNWNLDYVGNVHAQRFTVAGTSGAYYITKGTGDGADYTTYGCLFYTHNGVAFTANGGAVTLVVQGRSGRIMGKNAYYVNSSKCLKSDIRAVTSESEPMPVNLKQGEVVDETLTMEMIGDFIDTIGIRTYITDFEQEGATQKDVDPQQGHVLNLGYIADDLAHHPVFKYIGEKTPDNLYAINSNSLTTVALAGLQAERKERRKLEQRLQRLEVMLLKGDE